MDFFIEFSPKEFETVTQAPFRRHLLFFFSSSDPVYLELSLDIMDLQWFIKKTTSKNKTLQVGNEILMITKNEDCFLFKYGDFEYKVDNKLLEHEINRKLAILDKFAHNLPIAEQDRNNNNTLQLHSTVKEIEIAANEGVPYINGTFGFSYAPEDHSIYDSNRNRIAIEYLKTLAATLQYL